MYALPTVLSERAASPETIGVCLMFHTVGGCDGDFLIQEELPPKTI